MSGSALNNQGTLRLRRFLIVLAVAGWALFVISAFAPFFLRWGMIKPVAYAVFQTISFLVGCIIAYRRGRALTMLILFLLIAILVSLNWVLTRSFWAQIVAAYKVAWPFWATALAAGLLLGYIWRFTESVIHGQGLGSR